MGYVFISERMSNSNANYNSINEVVMITLDYGSNALSLIVMMYMPRATNQSGIVKLARQTEELQLA